MAHLERARARESLQAARAARIAQAAEQKDWEKWIGGQTSIAGW